MNLRTWRQREGLSLTEMGELIGRAHTTIMRLETGESLPDPVTMQAIYKATEGAVTLHDFLNIDGTPAQASAAE